MSDVYDYPQYYEIAFGFRDIPAEVDLIEECIKRYAKTPVKSILELGCGPCTHMIELTGRGYRFHGLDLNESMLTYAREKARSAGIEGNFIRADMVDFRVDFKVEFAMNLLDSLFTQSTAELTSHFDAVANVVKPGGLYLLDWCIQYEIPLEAEGGVSWEMEKSDIKVKTNVSWKAANRVEQLWAETITLEIDDHGKQLTAVGTIVKRAIYPQEFLLFIAQHPSWEFVGWWNLWDLNQPLEGQVKLDRPIALVRRV